MNQEEKTLNINEILQQIKPTLKICEKERKKILTILVSVLFAICGFLYWLLNLIYGDEADFDSALIFLLGLMGIVILIGFNILISLTNKCFKSYIKEKYIDKIISIINLKRLPLDINTSNIRNKFIRSNIFHSFNDIDIDDYYQGEYKNVPFDIIECDLGLKSEKNYQIVFHGVVISFKSNKNIVSDITIKSKRGIDANTKTKDVFAKFIFWTVNALIIAFAIAAMYMGAGAETPSITDFLSFLYHYTMDNIFAFLILGFVLVVSVLGKIKKRPKVTTEDVVFEKEFNIYSKDQIEARYIVTPTFMERLKSFSLVFGTTGQSWAFYNDTIMVAIPTRDDLFELGDLFHNITKGKDIQNFYKQIIAIANIIDHFKLDEKTGL